MDKKLRYLLAGVAACEIIVLLLAHDLVVGVAVGFTVINLALFFWLSSRPKSEPAKKQGWADSQDTGTHLDPSVLIAHETLPYMRRGLNEVTAQKIAEIILEISEAAAVAITDKDKVLSYLGAGCDKHQPGDRILTAATRDVLATGEHKVVRTQEELNCSRRSNCNCPLEAAVIVPLKLGEETVGTVKLYQTKDGQVSPQIVNLALGMAQLLGMQMELAQLDLQARLVTKAELDALQAQINPHFFFNTLNTIIMYSRTNPNRARRLMIRLSEFFRLALKRHGNFISIKEEMDFVNTYLILEKARFGPKLKIINDIEADLAEERIPRLTLQPLVENAVKHGITPKLGPGVIKISAFRDGGELVLIVEDDGVGIPPERLGLVLKPGYGSGNGVGLSNVNDRLKGYFGDNSGLKIKSTPNVGTTITMRIPWGSQAYKLDQQASEMLAGMKGRTYQG